jgi:hypothetical protein
MAASTTLASELIGTWRLLSREDRTADGEPRVDPGLGPDPIAILVYDTGGNFAAQFMKRDRSAASVPAAAAGANNSSPVNGYDAYFGTFTIDEASRTVTQKLEGSLSPGDVGKVVTREMRVGDGKLTIELQTTNALGERITRTLRWLKSS